jgi:hypothetical protein
MYRAGVSFSYLSIHSRRWRCNLRGHRSRIIHQRGNPCPKMMRQYGVQPHMYVHTCRCIDVSGRSYRALTSASGLSYIPMFFPSAEAALDHQRTYTYLAPHSSRKSSISRGGTKTPHLSSNIDVPGLPKVEAGSWFVYITHTHTHTHTHHSAPQAKRLKSHLAYADAKSALIPALQRLPAWCARKSGACEEPRQ